MKSLLARNVGVVVGMAALATGAHASILVTFSDPSGLGAEAEFSFFDPDTLQIRFRNTSTGVPGGFDSSDQILTGVSWDFGPTGLGGLTDIIGGSVKTGATSSSVNFSVLNVGPNTDVSGEWGFGNSDGTGALVNFLSANAAQGTPFGGPNLDGPGNIDGPQGGLVANPELVGLGGLGAIQDEVIASLDLSNPYTEAQLLTDFLLNGVRVEFGSDAAFLEGQVPGPGALGLLALGAIVGRRRRR